MAAQVPTLPVTLHASQVPLHALVQQTLSVQNSPAVQSFGELQKPPGPESGMHWWYVGDPDATSQCADTSQPLSSVQRASMSSRTWG